MFVLIRLRWATLASQVVIRRIKIYEIYEIWDTRSNSFNNCFKSDRTGSHVFIVGVHHGPPQPGHGRHRREHHWRLWIKLRSRRPRNLTELKTFIRTDGKQTPLKRDLKGSWLLQNSLWSWPQGGAVGCLICRGVYSTLIYAGSKLASSHQCVCR